MGAMRSVGRKARRAKDTVCGSWLSAPDLSLGVGFVLAYDAELTYTNRPFVSLNDKPRPTFGSKPARILDRAAEPLARRVFRPTGSPVRPNADTPIRYYAPHAGIACRCRNRSA
jgi:hypothetical protein